MPKQCLGPSLKLSLDLQAHEASYFQAPQFKGTSMIVQSAVI